MLAAVEESSIRVNDKIHQKVVLNYRPVTQSDVSYVSEVSKELAEDSW